MNLHKMFETSKLADDKEVAIKRSTWYVLSKCTEELGELSEEVQIKEGTSYKNPGKDGVRGEAVDLAITAMDMFYLEHKDKNLSVEELSTLFLETMNLKLQKWTNTMKK